MSNPTSLQWGIPFNAFTTSNVNGDSSANFVPSNTRVVNYDASGTAASATAKLRFSMDGGTTFTDTGQTADFVANPTGSWDCPSGPVYKLVLTALSGGTIAVNLNTDS